MDGQKKEIVLNWERKWMQRRKGKERNARNMYFYTVVFLHEIPRGGLLFNEKNQSSFGMQVVFLLILHGIQTTYGRASISVQLSTNRKVKKELLKNSDLYRTTIGVDR